MIRKTAFFVFIVIAVNFPTFLFPLSLQTPFPSKSSSQATGKNFHECDPWSVILQSALQKVNNEVAQTMLFDSHGPWQAYARERQGEEKIDWDGFENFEENPALWEDSDKGCCFQFALEAYRKARKTLKIMAESWGSVEEEFSEDRFDRPYEYRITGKLTNGDQFEIAMDIRGLHCRNEKNVYNPEYLGHFFTLVRLNFPGQQREYFYQLDPAHPEGILNVRGSLDKVPPVKREMRDARFRYYSAKKSSMTQWVSEPLRADDVRVKNRLGTRSVMRQIRQGDMVKPAKERSYVLFSLLRGKGTFYQRGGEATIEPWEFSLSAMDETAWNRLAGRLNIDLSQREIWQEGLQTLFRSREGLIKDLILKQEIKHMLMVMNNEVDASKFSEDIDQITERLWQNLQGMDKELRDIYPLSNGRLELKVMGDDKGEDVLVFEIHVLAQGLNLSHSFRETYHLRRFA